MAAFTLLGLPLAAQETQEDEWIDLGAMFSDLKAGFGSADEWDFGAYVKGVYEYSDDAVYTTDPVTFQTTDSLSNFEFDSIGVNVKKDVGPVRVKIGYNPRRSRLRSTYVRFDPTRKVRVTLGRFKVPLLQSRLVRTTRLLFRDRTFQARETGPREDGVKAEVDFSDETKLYAALQDGDDDGNGKLRSTVRFVWTPWGGDIPRQEGSYGVDPGPALSLGLGLMNDHTYDDGQTIAADFIYTQNRFSLSGERLKHGDGFPMYRVGTLDPVSRIDRAGTRPWGVTTGWMVLEDQLEAAARLEEFDDLNQTSRLGFSVNWYHKGHKVKSQLTWYTVDSDNALLESDIFSVGITVEL